MRRIAMLLISLASTITILAWFRDLDIYLVFLGLISFHELGHALACIIMGYKFEVSYHGGIGAHVGMYSERDKIDTLDNLLFSLMGPFFSWLALLASFLLLHFRIETEVSSVALVISMWLVVLNTSPILSSTDGSTIGKALVDLLDISKENREDPRVTEHVANAYALLVPTGLSSVVMMICFAMMDLESELIRHAFFHVVDASPYGYILNLLGLS